MKRLTLVALMMVSMAAVGDTKLAMYDVQRLCDERSTEGIEGPYTCAVSTNKKENDAWWMVVQYMSISKYQRYTQIVEMEHIKPFCSVVESSGQSDALIYEILTDRDSVYKRKRFCKAGIESSSFPE